MINFVNRRGLWLDWIDVQRAALAAALRSSDPRSLAVAQRGLAHASFHLGHHDKGATHGHVALDLYRRLDDRAGEAQTHLVLGNSAVRQEDYATALTHYLRARALYEDIGHEAGRANALNNAGWVRIMLGDFDDAVALCEQAVRIAEAVDDRYLLGTNWDTLGYAHHHLGHHQRAITCYRRALELVREQGDRYFEAETLTHLGDTHAVIDDPRRAHDAWLGAVRIYDELGHPEADQLRAKLRSTDSGNGLHDPAHPS
jgi:tetratricopeptide (TPR) repeat protein